MNDKLQKCKTAMAEKLHAQLGDAALENPTLCALFGGRAQFEALVNEASEVESIGD
jgi:hypothetical protein